MYHKLIVLFAVILWSATTLPLQKEAIAQTALNRAVVQNIRNLVRLIPRNRTARPARVSDAMKPGDALSTGRSSLAELRFNDGSLARIGEQAVFRFLAKTRNFNLSNGTVLLLIPPGRGTTNLRTPNAAAAIRGSALFVRYIPTTNTTIIGSLTDSNIEVSNDNSSQSQVLEAGQLAVIVEDRIEQLYEFDLDTFYETSDLVQELDLKEPPEQASSDPAIASVQAETSQAAAAQPPVTGEGVIENPAFVQPAAPVTPPTEPKLEPAPEPKPEPKPEPVPEPKPEPEEPEVTPEPEEPEVIPKPEPEEPEVIPKPEPEEPEVTPEPQPEEPEVTPEPQPDEPEVIPEPEPDEPEVIPEPEAEEPEVIPEPEPDEPEVTPEPEPDEPEVTPEPQPDEPEVTPEPEAEEPEVTPEPQPDEPEVTPEPQPDEPEVTPEPEPDEPEVTPEPQPDEPEVTPEPEVEEPEVTPEPEPVIDDSQVELQDSGIDAQELKQFSSIAYQGLDKKR